MRVCLCFNPDLNDSLFDELIKRPNIHQSLISGNQRLTCPRCQYLLWPVWGWDTSWVLADTRQRCAGADKLSEPGETQSVSARSARCITASHVSRDPSRVTKFWVLTCDCCEVWLKLSQVVINLSLWVWQEEFANKTFPHLSRESTSNIEKQLQCVSVTLITSCKRDGRVSGVIFISDGSLWLLYNINTHYIGAQEREKTPVRFIIHSKIGISGGDNDW